MNDFYKMDVFFVIASVAAIILTIVVTVAVVYGIKILRDVRYIISKAKEQTDSLAEDLTELRANVREEGAKLKHLGSFISSIYKRSKKK